MVDVKGFNGGLNTDSALELLPSGDYTYAMNISNGSEGIVNLLGNRLLETPPAPTQGTDWVCGAFFDRKRNRIIYFTNNSEGRHRIISLDTEKKVYTVLFEDDLTSSGAGLVFGWKIYEKYHPDGVIKDIKVLHRDYEGDLYYFIDPKKRLLKFNYNNILKYKAANTELCAYGWTDANYDGTTLRDGTAIPQVVDTTAWGQLTTPAWCYYNNDPANNDVYGKLYNWYAVSNPLFAPLGFRVPTSGDYGSLITCLGGNGIAGGKMKSKSSLWQQPNTGATNESFFNALPAGFRNPSGNFLSLGFITQFWTSSDSGFPGFAFQYPLLHDSAGILGSVGFKEMGFSVRLIKQ